MIYGTGCDLTSVERIASSLAREGFAERVFSPLELSAFDGPKRLEKLAGCFAAKEAFGKALGTGVRGFALREVAVLRDELAKPYYSFSGSAEELVLAEKLAAHLSLSNEGGLAMAFTVLEKRE